MGVQLSPAKLPDPTDYGTTGWTKASITRIEDLSDAVYGAGLRAVQMSRVPVKGSLVFAEHDGITYSSGLIEGRTQLIGPLSQSKFTFGIGLNLAPGSRQWFREVADGDIGVYMPGDEHDALHFPGAMYAAITLGEERAEKLGSVLGRVLDVRKLGGSAVFPGHVSPSDLRRLQTGFKQLHATGIDSMQAGELLVSVLIDQLGRLPQIRPSEPDYQGRSRIVRRCREYIDENLHERLSMEVLARATGTSVRTLFRSFIEVLDETPLHYVRRLRLHRIRYDLLNSTETERTVSVVANRWGITELGRFAGWYRDQFGEMPSQTMARVRRV